MSDLDDLLGSIPFDQLAGLLGVDAADARAAVEQAAPALLAGLEANAQDPAGAASLASALDNHDAGLLDGLDLSSLDLSDGAKILGHIFGGNTDQVATQLSGANNLSASTVTKLLPLLAPLVMAYVKKKMSGGTKAESASGGGLGDLLGGLIGGSGGGLGDLLGGLLGGGTK
jgi:hypothetical protein